MSDQADLSRRQFVVLAAGCAAVCACGGAAIAAPTTKPGATIDIGTLADYPKDGVSDKFVKSDQILVIRDNGELFAATALCPHKGAVMKVKDGGIFCPKHGSTFSPEGTVTKGPAKSSLERYAISTDDKGHLIVDTSQAFREVKWSDPKSFVKVS